MELEVRIARAFEELEEIYKLRYQIYSQVGYIKKEDYPDGKETDKWDKFSEHFYVYSKSEKKTVGAMRFVPDSEKGFPIEELYDISFLRKKYKNVVEVSRRITLPNRPKANYLLLQMMCQYAKLKSITCLLCSVNPTAFAFYDKLGCIQFGEEKFYKEVNMPAIGMYLEVDNLKPPYNKKLFEPFETVILGE